MQAGLPSLYTNLTFKRREARIATNRIVRDILSKIPESDQPTIIRSLASEDIEVPHNLFRNHRRNITQIPQIVRQSKPIPIPVDLQPNGPPHTSFIERNAHHKLTHLAIKSQYQDGKRQQTRANTIIDEIRFGSAYYTIDEPEYVLSHPDLEISMRKFYEIPYPDIIVVNFPIHKIYISGIKGANDAAMLRQHGIYAVLTVGENNDPYHSSHVQGGYSKIPMSDKKDFKFKSYIETGRRLLEAMLKNGNVLVHDYAGISRACALVAGYYMRQYGIELEEAISLLKKNKPEVDISHELTNQLTTIRLKSPE
jgi:protein-tyrosine phosphatase